MADAEREALLTAWVDRYSDSLLRMCFISLRDWALAEDALQETFIKAWRAMPQYEHSPIRNERAWLSRIAVNVCRDLRRTRWMRHVDAAQALETLPPSQLAVEPEDRTLLLDILAMPEKYRQVLILYHYQRLTMREVAQVLGADVSTVHARLKKAEGMLRRELTEEVDGQ
ncbi:MAG: sigma-70 family RNA polymerase sigma factor [Clostridia bacterium]|nr:sigma-70 family RNA polymerase sigma factor [Clostridia bacterium]